MIAMSLSKQPSRYRYNSPRVQMGLLGVICFLVQGMFSALDGLGGGGESNPTITDNANTAFAVSFALCSLVAGGVFNVIGPTFILPFGSLAYALYISSYIMDTAPFVISAGGVLGVGAGLVWATEGAITLSYPDEGQKGKYVGFFWSMYSGGATLGSLIVFVIERNNIQSSSISKTNYIVFIACMVIGALLSLLLLPPGKVIRDNLEPVSIHNSSWKRELVGIVSLFTDWRMVALLPMFLTSNWVFTYQFNCFNGGGYFTTRTRAFNGMVLFTSQILGSNLMGIFLDSTKVVSKSRRTRAVAGQTVMLVLTTLTWGGAFGFQLSFSRASLENLPDNQKVDFTETRRYVVPVIVYASFGIFDAAKATYISWILGALTNDTPIAARFAGYFRFIQNVGVALAGQLDARKVPYLAELLIDWGLLMAGILPAYAVACSVSETSSYESPLEVVGKSFKGANDHAVFADSSKGAAVSIAVDTASKMNPDFMDSFQVGLKSTARIVVSKQPLQNVNEPSACCISELEVISEEGQPETKNITWNC